uniref:Alpha-galactosidase n=1 Tax=uncultured firmicutes bacterium contig_31 TaxID=1643554 RepID=A0A141GNE9_9FIRM|nr:alpha-galactosidase [uncultured firmicutes bacterium contig_31]
MGIKFFENQKYFKLDAKDTSYIIAIVDDEKFLGHVYFGKRIPDEPLDIESLMRINEPPFVPSKNNRERMSFHDCFPTEYPTHGLGDFRESCLVVKDGNGHSVCGITYCGHRIYRGKPALKGLPATFGDEDSCTTLEITCRDSVLNLEVILVYTVFENLDVITRSVKVKNNSDKSIKLEKVLSVCVDFDGMDYDIISLHGSWARERRIQRIPVSYGKKSIESTRGVSSHQINPFIALLDRDANEDYGNVYGFNFVYSGNFLAAAEGEQFDTTRVVMGIHPSNFEWNLAPGEEFTAPEVVMVYSDSGTGKMTRTFHDLYRNHLIRGRFRDRKRPVLLNSWEAVYFDFDTEKLLSLAREAAKLGIEMLVMDDGWFGRRNSDNCSLGDWYVNEEKIKGGLKHLVDEVNKLGLEFGIWFEPEMISPDSDLYRTHPDWCIHVPNRTPVLSRNQYVLDLTNDEIVEYVYSRLRDILSGANITYVKWDMNRQLSDLGSSFLPKERQGEIMHRYVLAVYKLLDRLTEEFPHILLETCSGGGGRFDPGMLYYSPQIWCSDNTDAIERLVIQHGTAMVYPLSAIGAHVSDCPNHLIGRSTPFETRGYVALAGTFGYELDITRLSEEDRKMISIQIEMYHKYNDLIRTGDYYRIANYTDNRQYDCWAVVSKDRSEALVTYIQVLQRPNYKSRRIYLKGLDEEAIYRDTETNRVYSGSALMHAGLNIKGIHGDFKGKLIHLVKEK